MKVLIVPEDFRNDQFILQPIIEAMLSEIGKPRANVRVCRDPLLGGVSRALDWDEIESIIRRYAGMVDLILLCVDRDGKPGRRAALDEIEKRADEVMPAGKKLFGVDAWQEVEVWALAGLEDLPKDWKWPEIRQDVDVKERYFEPLAEQRDLTEEPGEGRKTLGRQSAKRFDRIRQLCPEDVALLEQRIRDWFASLT